MSKIRTLLIEDNPLLREGIVALINKQADMKVVAALRGYEKSLIKARSLRAQVILVDLSGLRAVTLLTKKSPELKIIGMGLLPTQADIFEFVQAGASGFIMKNATVTDFLATIRTVARGGKVLPPMLTQSLFARVIEHAVEVGKASPANAVHITKREREIVDLINMGLGNKEIAAKLNISTDTVKSHVHNILEKLALRSRLQLSAHALDL